MGLLSIVIPAYNEVATVGQVVDLARAAPLPGSLEREVLVVDDASTDGTGDVLRARAAAGHVRLISQDRNRGKAAALRAGFAAAAGDVVLIQDADLEYDPSDYSKLLGPILSGRADVVFGSRFLGAGERRVLFFWHAVGNRFLTLLSNVVTDLNLTDMETGYKVFRREVLQALEIESDRFGFEPEITAKVALGGWRIYEVPISYFGRTYAQGKKIGWKDGIQALGCIAKYGLLGRLRGQWLPVPPPPARSKP